MRSSLSELPVLLMCLRGGLIAGALIYLLRLPWRIKNGRLCGRRAPFALKAGTCAADVLAGFCTAALLAATLLKVNGGEPRLYTLLGFAAGAFASHLALRSAAF